MTIYKSLLRPHLDLGGIIYGQTFNNSFHEGVESIQDNATVIITGAIRGNFRLLILQQRRWYRKLQSPKYLPELIPTTRQTYLARHKKQYSSF